MSADQIAYDDQGRACGLDWTRLGLSNPPREITDSYGNRRTETVEYNPFGRSTL